LLLGNLNADSYGWAIHGIRSSTRSQSIRGCSTAPSLGRTVVSQITLAHRFGISVTCRFKSLMQHAFGQFLVRFPTL